MKWTKITVLGSAVVAIVAGMLSDFGSGAALHFSLLAALLILAYLTLMLIQIREEISDG